ncbi:MAG: zinc ribbon domain-containing protein [candidate division KSB1 bacterium]|nr:zinc ribbon domain-containing protein [candidate division KSB1 bacterium]
MPTYEYGCIDCGEKFDVFASISQKERGLKPGCPKCGGTQTVQLFRSINFVKSNGSSPDAAFRTAGGCGPNPMPGCCGG